MANPIPTSREVSFRQLVPCFQKPHTLVSGYGHDKSRAILPYREVPEPPTLFFFGDGVSGSHTPIHALALHTYLFPDMSAARHADVLFVKQPEGQDSDLHLYCQREGIKHVLFTEFAEALPIVQSIVSGEKTKEEVLGN